MIHKHVYTLLKINLHALYASWDFLMSLLLVIYMWILPCWCLHLVVVGELEYPIDPESYATGSVATGRATLGGQVEG